jgi:hypothetical protein
MSPQPQRRHRENPNSLSFCISCITSICVVFSVLTVAVKLTIGASPWSTNLPQKTRGHTIAWGHSMPELKLSVVAVAGILLMSEPASENVCRLMDAEITEASPVVASNSLCFRLPYSFPTHNHREPSPDEPTTVVVISGSGVNVSASVVSFTCNSIHETKSAIVREPITAALLERVYILTALKVLHEYPLLSDIQARDVFRVCQLDALRMKVCTRFEGDVNLSVAALALGFERPPPFAI